MGSRPRTIIFIHGMFNTPSCWDGWVARFEAAGDRCFAPAWPLHDAPVAELRRRHPDPALGALTFREVVARFDAFVASLDEPPILIGHSIGGLVTQLLLQRGRAAAGVAITSVAPFGVISLRWSFLRSIWPTAAGRISQPHRMTFDEYRYGFAPGLPDDEARLLFERDFVPESRRIPWPSLTPKARIDFSRPHPPLLFVAGGADHIIPPTLNRANFRRYRDRGSVTEYREFPGRAHVILGQAGWEEVADSVHGWIESLTLSAAH